MCNFSYIYTYKSWPCLKMKDSKRQNSMYKPDVRCKEMIFFSVQERASGTHL